MYARMTRIRTDPAKLDGWVAHFKEDRGTAYQKAPGYAGTLVLVNRETGAGTAYSYWETLGAMNASEQVAQEDKRQVIRATGIEVRDLDRFEVVALERKGELSVPLFALLGEFYVAPDRLDNVIEFGRSLVVPETSALQGYVTFMAGVNRMTCRSWGASVWDSLDARTAANAAATARRTTVSEMEGVTGMRVSEWEVAFAQIKQPASIG